ncbi:hypothetical protein AGMMS49975_05120 [Clostridia bacterium]|nr:hypothetical protein AGMMS49975_05120 [Clostridia bacterium]
MVGAVNAVSGVNSTYEVYSAKKTQAAARLKPHGEKDKISISRDAKNFQAALRALSDVPDIRPNIPENLAARKFSSASTADKILKNAELLAI